MKTLMDILLRIGLCVIGYSITLGIVSAQSGNRITLPIGLFNQLKKDDADIRKMFPRGYNANSENESGTIFCEEVQLNADSKPEYVITMIGGNSSGPIWVYRKAANGYQQLLDAGTMSYSVLKEKTRGYYDLRFESGGLSSGYYLEVYAFNGRKYVLKSRKHRMDQMPT